MKKGIHPDYREVQVTCGCGHQFAIHSSLQSAELRVDVCASCHPFYSGKQRVLDTRGRVERFNKRFGRRLV